MRLLFALLAVSSACSLYNGNDSQPPAGCEVAPAQAEKLIDPSTNQCVTYPVMGWDGCEPCYDVDRAGSGGCLALDGWPQCDGACASLAEEACLTTASCHATYLADAAGASFWMCDVAGPYQAFDEPCTALDAVGCSTRDDCTATYIGSTANANFASCAPELSP